MTCVTTVATLKVKKMVTTTDVPLLQEWDNYRKKLAVKVPPLYADILDKKLLQNRVPPQ